MPEINAYVEARIQRELGARLADESRLVRDIGIQAEASVLRRWKWFAAFVGLFSIVLGSLGFKSCSDANKAVVAEARERVKPLIDQTERQVHEAQTKVSDAQAKIGKVAEQVPSLQKRLDDTAQIANEQIRRVTEVKGDIAKKLTQLQLDAQQADKISTQLEAQIKSIESRRKEYETQFTRFARASDQNAVFKVYPNLGQEPYATFNGGKLDRANKKPNEKWVNVYLTPYIVQKDLVSSAAIQRLLGDLRNSGYTPFLGVLFSAGRITGAAERMGPGSYYQSNVFYFDPDFRQAAVALAALAERDLSVKLGAPVLVDPQKAEGAALRVILEKSGIDCQIFISTNP